MSSKMIWGWFNDIQCYTETSSRIPSPSSLSLSHGIKVQEEHLSYSSNQEGGTTKGGKCQHVMKKGNTKAKEEAGEEERVTSSKTKRRWGQEWGRYSEATLFRKRQQCHRLPHSVSHYPDKFKDVITQILFFLVVISINYWRRKGYDLIWN